MGSGSFLCNLSSLIRPLLRLLVAILAASSRLFVFLTFFIFAQLRSLVRL
jgi:hypothetical protein